VPDNDTRRPDIALGRSEALRAEFDDAAVVQLVAGDPAHGDATVVEVHPATIVLTDQRIVATDGDLEWEWHLGDVEAVHHGTDEPWTIVVVPGIDDHGVSVAVRDRDRFRDLLDELLPRTARHDGGAPDAGAVVWPPPSTEPGPPGAGAGDPLVEEHALEHHADLPAVRTEAEPEVVATASVPVATAIVARDEIGALADTDDVRDLTGSPTAAVGAVTLGADLPDTEDEDPAVGSRRRFARGGRRGAVTTVEPLPLAGLEAREISAWFGTHHVLDRVSLVMEPGQVTALIGPSGCGKSTFLRILNRMHEMIPVASLAGEVLLDGEDIYDPQKKLTEARRQIGMVFQKPNPFPAMSIYDNVVAAYKLTGTKINHTEKDDVVESCLTKAGLWTEVRDRLRAPGGGLSGGQQQRLCIARALAIKPRVLLMDEPCSALDPTSTRRIEETIMELGSEVTIVIVTHHMQQAARVSDQCAFFLAEQGTPGVIVEHGPTDAMFHSPQDPRTYDYVNGRFG
jgi:phosphate transport system ATP-binding protein